MRLVLMIIATMWAAKSPGSGLSDEGASVLASLWLIGFGWAILFDVLNAKKKGGSHE